MGLFRWSVWSRFNFVFVICLGNCPFPPDSPVVLSIGFCSKIWWFFWISSVFVVISPFSFLILLIWILSLCPWVSLVYLSCWFSQRTSSWFCWFFVWFSCFYLIDFNPEFDDFLSSTPPGWISFLFSRAFKYAIKMLVYALSSFIFQALRAMSFPLSTAFIVSYRFGYVVP